MFIRFVLRGLMAVDLAGGFGGYIAVDIIRGKLKSDDSLDVFAVHGVGGIIGSLLVAFLALPVFGCIGLADGVTAGSQFMVQLASAAITVAWTLVVSVIILMIAKAVAGLRVDDQTEVDGLALAEHGERASEPERGRVRVGGQFLEAGEGDGGLAVADVERKDGHHHRSEGEDPEVIQRDAAAAGGQDGVDHPERARYYPCLLYTSPSPRDQTGSPNPASA